MEKEKRHIGDELKEIILKQLIEPSYYGDVKETIKGRKCWRVSGHVFESMSKILLAASGVISFAAGVYDYKILSFVAGTLSTISLATFQFSLYSFKQHKKNSMELNLLLEKINIESVPIFEQCDKSDDSPMFRKAEDDKPNEEVTEIEMIKLDNKDSLLEEGKYKEEKEDKKEDKNKIEEIVGKVIDEIKDKIL
jgi:hypothetical protein